MDATEVMKPVMALASSAISEAVRALEDEQIKFLRHLAKDLDPKTSSDPDGHEEVRKWALSAVECRLTRLLKRRRMSGMNLDITFMGSTITLRDILKMDVMPAPSPTQDPNDPYDATPVMVFFAQEDLDNLPTIPEGWDNRAYYGDAEGTGVETGPASSLTIKPDPGDEIITKLTRFR